MLANSRRKARLCAFRALYAIDVGGVDVDAAIADAIGNASLSGNGDEFAMELVRGVSERINELDKKIGELARGYSVDRLAAVDRSLLRLAAYELLCSSTPPAVAINEAVEMAKKYSTNESGAFVNGILSQIARQRQS